jgi:hypothetical protein
MLNLVLCEWPSENAFCPKVFAKLLILQLEFIMIVSINLLSIFRCVESFIIYISCPLLFLFFFYSMADFPDIHGTKLDRDVILCLQHHVDMKVLWHIFVLLFLFEFFPSYHIIFGLVVLCSCPSYHFLFGPY